MRLLVNGLRQGAHSLLPLLELALARQKNVISMTQQLQLVETPLSCIGGSD